MQANTHPDGKLYYSIGEVSELLGESPNIIRSWEKESGVLAPRKSKKGDRLFTAKDLERLRAIQYVVREKEVGIKGVKKYLALDQKLKQQPKVDLIGTLLSLKEVLIEVLEETQTEKKLRQQ